ncbi:MAG: hypothetical protein JWP74_1718 [Marmoricola sp.]|nr:hypothetical protein [Marmoricola sp.]
MSAFRKKPVIIEARRFNGAGHEANEVCRWITNGGGTVRWFQHREERRASNGELSQSLDPEHLRIATLEGTMRAEVGDWIICGVQGEFYPCKPDIFDATYEPVTA